ncbi:hypothetical protein EVAR_75908_1 [Eumeta japonica]|uniref:Uncharacterized protein n=1 Tax=Eumeta variegata TaxID=151549 RepID=A0A4C1UXF7_EUMVA|nr:hypothetical protein EVAR_75908_1 [Eumeta japonica]
MYLLPTSYSRQRATRPAVLRDLQYRPVKSGRHTPVISIRSRVTHFFTIRTLLHCVDGGTLLIHSNGSPASLARADRVGGFRVTGVLEIAS